MTLIEALQTIPDPRSSLGRRYPLWVFLLLIILGTMSGYRGYRGLARFMHRHQEHLATRLGLPRVELPSYSTIRRLLNAIDFDAVAKAFTDWAQAVGLLQAGDDCAVDGKGLKNTVTDAHSKQQNFVNVVSMWCRCFSSNKEWWWYKRCLTMGKRAKLTWFTNFWNSCRSLG